MSVSVPRPGNVDGEGGKAYGLVRGTAMVGSRWDVQFHTGHRLRIWMEQTRLQRWWSLRRAGTARIECLDCKTPVLFPAAVETVFTLAELSNDADDNGTDDARGGA